MIMFKKKKTDKIQAFLNGKSDNEKTPFDELLTDYLTTDMITALEGREIRKIDIHVDWLEDYKCIQIQGKCRQNYIDIQIEPREFSIGCDSDEPDADEDDYYTLESKKQFYTVLDRYLS